MSDASQVIAACSAALHCLQPDPHGQPTGLHKFGFLESLADAGFALLALGCLMYIVIWLKSIKDIEVLVYSPCMVASASSMSDTETPLWSTARGLFPPTPNCQPELLTTPLQSWFF